MVTYSRTIYTQFRTGIKSSSLSVSQVKRLSTHESSVLLVTSYFFKVHFKLNNSCSSVLVIIILMSLSDRENV